jgi:hypothetical protein
MTPDQHALLRELLAVSGGDAVFRPSSIDRVIGCPGSVVMAARLPKVAKRSTPAQIEGSAAHKVAEDALKGIRQPDEWSDRTVRLNDVDTWIVDAEMAEAIADVYLPEVFAREGAGTERFIEHKLSLSPLDPSDPLFAENRGTGDCVVLNRNKRKLSIIDLKYGKGVMVPGDSPQLKDYALMAFVTFGMDGGWEEVETVVVQPRAFNEDQRIKPVSFAPMDLLDGFLPELVSAMEEALSPNARLAPSEKNCLWCPAKDACPALRDRALHLARDAFAKTPLLDASSPLAPIPGVLVGTVDHPRPKASGNVAVLPSVLDLDPGGMATLLDRFDLYDAFKKAVQQRVAQMLQAGVAVPGWTLEPRTGNRRFKEPDAIPEAFVALGAAAKDVPSLLRALGAKSSEMFTEPKLKSPAQVEKGIPKDKRDLVALLVERPLGEPALVRTTAAKAGSTQASGHGRLGSLAEVPGA